MMMTLSLLKKLGKSKIKMRATPTSESGTALLRGCMKFKACQPQVVDVDGQLGHGAVPQAVPSPRSKAADRECFQDLVVDHYPLLCK
jgi:hypothetical protein